MKIFIQILIWIHCFPQKLLGFIISKTIWRKSKVGTPYKESVCLILEKSTIFDSFSLADYIFMDIDDISTDTIRHEYGHYLQGLILGWLYIPVIAIPSICWNIACRINSKLDYNSFYTEKWANWLGK